MCHYIHVTLILYRELGDSATVAQCHFDLGSLYLQETRPALALRCFREALSVSNEQRSWQQDAEILREMSQVCGSCDACSVHHTFCVYCTSDSIHLQAHLLMSNFHEAKSCLKKVVRLFQENSQLGETDTDKRKLSTGSV